MYYVKELSNLLDEYEHRSEHGREGVQFFVAYRQLLQEASEIEQKAKALLEKYRLG